MKKVLLEEEEDEYSTDNDNDLNGSDDLYDDLENAKGDLDDLYDDLENVKGDLDGNDSDDLENAKGEGEESDQDDLNDNADDGDGDGNEENDNAEDGTIDDDEKKKKREHKELKKQRKLQKPNQELIQNCKLIWEELRQRKTTKERRRELMIKMMSFVKEKTLDIIFKHDASRIIQSCLKYGNTEERNQIASELVGSYSRLSLSKYGRFIVQKVLQYCSEFRPLVIKDFYGKVRKMIRHKEASLVLDEAYSQYANSAQRMSLMEEFYGPEFTVFKSNYSSLGELLEKNPLKKPSILKYLKSAIDSVLEKASFNVGRTPILHRAILDYLTLADPLVCKDMIELLKDHLVHMLHTREGCLVTQYCILHSTPKDRKQIIKTFKGFVHNIAKEQYGHAVLITCFECIDDTVLVGKAIVGELFKPSAEFKVNELMRDQYGSRVVLYLLCGRNKKYQPLYLVQELQGTDQVRKETTKKEHDARHEQLLEVASPMLVEVLVEFANELLHDKNGSAIILETFNNVKSDTSALTSVILDLVEKAVNGDFDAHVPIHEEEDGPINVVKKMKQEKDTLAQLEQGLDLSESLLVNRFSTLTLKALVRKPRDGDSPPWKTDFTARLYTVLFPHLDKCLAYCAKSPRTTSGLAFIFVALIENGTDEMKSGIKTACKKSKKGLKKTVDDLLKNEGGEGSGSGTKKRKSGSGSTGIQVFLELVA